MAAWQLTPSVLGSHHLAGRRILVAQVVLHMPVLGVRQDFVEHLLHRLDRTVQTNEVGDIGIQATGVVSNLLEETSQPCRKSGHRCPRHLESDLLAVPRCVLCQPADQRSRPTAHPRRLVVVPAFGQPETYARRCSADSS
jgi:hypothetical protein